MRTRLHLTSLAAAVIGLLLIPATAFAYAPTGDDFITCVADGDENVECVAGVFDPGSDVEVTTPEGSQTVTADDEGEVSFNFNAEVAGEQEVRLEGTFNGEVKVLAEVVANRNEAGEVIANAGSNAGLLAIGAVGAIALGGGALFLSRRNRTGTPA